MAMIESLVVPAIIVAIMGSGLVAGLLFIFSIAVMPALGSVPPAHGVGVMKAVNRDILNPWFGVVFFGTALVLLLLAVWAVVKLLAPFDGMVGLEQEPASGSAVSGIRDVPWLLAAGVAYWLGVLGVTAMVNVPLNNHLAGLRLDSEAIDREWARYHEQWTRWNHVRTLACLLALTCLALALV